MAQALASSYKIDISNCSQLIAVALGAIVYNFEFELRMSNLIALAPSLKVPREFVIRHYKNRLQIGNILKIVHHPFNDRLPTEDEQRLGFVEGQWIKACCISGRED